MAIVNFFGCETGNAIELVTTSGTFDAAYTAIKRTGTYAFRSNPTTTAVGYGQLGQYGATGVAATFSIANVFATIYFRYTTKPAANNEPILNFGGSSVIELRLSSTGVLSLYNLTTLINNGSTVLAANTWYRIEINLNDTANTQEVKLDGVTEITGTNATGGAFTSISLGKTSNRNGQTVDFIYDDVCVDNAGYPGEGECKISVPIGNGAGTGWTNGTTTAAAGTAFWQQVLEIPANTTDYIATTAFQSNADSTNDMQAFATIGGSGAIGAVKSIVYAATGSISGSSSVAHRRIFNGSAFELTALEMTVAYQTFSKVDVTDPSASGVITEADFDSIEVGMATNTIAQVQRYSAAYLTVWYVPAAGAVSVTPANATLVTATFVPVVTASNHISLTPGIATLATALFTPTVSLGIRLTPTNATLVLASFAPTVATPTLLTPATVALSLATFAPTVTAGGSALLTPAQATLALTGFAPTVTATAPPSAYETLILSDGPVHYWRLGESGAPFVDLVGGMDLSTGGSPTPGASSLLVSDGANGAVDFESGTSDNLLHADDTSLDITDPITIEAWIKPESVTGGTNYGIVSKGQTAYYLRINGSGQLEILNSNTAIIAHSAATLSAGNTYHVVGTKSGGLSSGTHLYINGVEDTVWVGNSNFINSNKALRVGADDVAGSPNQFFDGVIDEVALYNTALSSAQILAHYTAGSTIAAPVSVTPANATLALATFAPVVTATANVSVTPTTATLITTGFVPIIGLTVTPSTAALFLTGFAPRLGLTVTPSSSALTLSAFAPTVTASNHQSVTPTTKAVVLATFAPTVAVSNNISVTPLTATLVTTGFAPRLDQKLTPTNASLVITGFVPTVVGIAHVVVTPATATLVLATFSPSVIVTAASTLTPGSAALTLTTFAPVVAATAHVRLEPTTASLVTSGFVPAVLATAHVSLTPLYANFVITAFAPTVTATAQVSVTPAPASLVLSSFAPTVTTTANVSLTPAPASLITTLFTPTVISGIFVTPATATLTLVAFAPTVIGAANVTLTPAPATLVLTSYAPTVSTPRLVTPGPATLVTTTFAPAVSATANVFLTPATLLLTITLFTPSIQLGGSPIAEPTPGFLILTTYAPTISLAGWIGLIGRYDTDVGLEGEHNTDEMALSGLHDTAEVALTGQHGQTGVFGLIGEFDRSINLEGEK